MAQTPRRAELSRLNVLFCLLVVFIHTASHPVSALDRLSWQYALVMIPQRLSFVAVPGFFLLSGVKLTLPRKHPQPLSAYWMGRTKNILLPYLLAALVYYLTFVYGLRWFPFSLSNFLGYVIRGDLSSPFYFLITLFQFILLAPLFRWLSERWSPCVLLPFALGVTWLSSMYLNSILQLFVPEASFRYADRVFTSYLVYYLAGCCIGRHYDRFLALLEENRGLITGLFFFFACADGGISLMAFSGRRSAPYLEFVHTLYILSAILFFYGAAVRRTSPLPRWAADIDRASYLIYLYHCLVITLFNNFTARLGLSRVSVLFVLRIFTAYSITIAACILWQRLVRQLKTNIKKEEIPT